VNHSNLRLIYDRLVARVRIEIGEVTAFRNSLILMNAYLGTQPFATREQRHALLGIFYIAIDLAAQLNDFRALFILAGKLKNQVKNHLTGNSELAILNRLVADAESRGCRYGPQFEYDSRIVKEADRLANAALS
jgi:hypothetical protein